MSDDWRALAVKSRDKIIPKKPARIKTKFEYIAKYTFWLYLPAFAVYIVYYYMSHERTLILAIHCAIISLYVALVYVLDYILNRKHDKHYNKYGIWQKMKKESTRFYEAQKIKFKKLS